MSHLSPHLLGLLQQRQHPLGHFPNDFCLLAFQTNRRLDLVVVDPLDVGLGELLDWYVDLYLDGFSFLEGAVLAALAGLDLAQFGSD